MRMEGTGRHPRDRENHKEVPALFSRSDTGRLIPQDSLRPSWAEGGGVRGT